MRIVILLFFCSSFIWAQNGRVENNERLRSLVERYEVKHGMFPSSIGNGPLYRSDVYNYFGTIDSLENGRLYEWDEEYILNELAEFDEYETNIQSRFFKNFYQNPAYFFSLKKEDFWLSINPGVNFFIGKEKDQGYLANNTRVAKIRGEIGKRIYFASNIYENQVAFTSYHTQLINKYNTIPGQSIYKKYRFPYVIDQRGFDFLNADGYGGLKFNKYLTAELGHGRHFVGYGDRSLILSDYATNYLFFRLNVNVWKFDYQTIFKELLPYSARVNSNTPFPKKYAVSHILSFQINNNIEIGLFESIVYERPDHFEFQYLNPIILYRSVEHLLGSTDNALLGGQFKINFLNSFQLYGQLMVDELYFGIIRDDWTWWGNKWSGQMGLKYIDALQVDHLDLTAEFNMARPFTYTHNDTLVGTNISPANYSHFSQALAHPLGSNFYEFIGKMKFVPIPKIILDLRYVYSMTGLDQENNFVGQNILQNNRTRSAAYGYKIGDGDQVNVHLFNFTANYMFYHNYNLELIAQYRTSSSVLPEYNNNSIYLGAGLRVNVFNKPIDY